MTYKRQPNVLKRADSEDLKRHSYPYSDSDSDGTSNEPLPEDLDEPWPFLFQSGDQVWIRTPSDHWHLGRISGQTRKGLTRQKEGLFYPVIFSDRNHKIREYFAPLNGDIKPDLPHVRYLLREAGFL